MALKEDYRKLLTIGAGCLAVGSAIWYLTRDTELASFDPKTHTVEKLREIIHEIYVEQTTFLCQKLNAIRQKKAVEQFNEKILAELRQVQEKESQETEKEICSQNEITPRLLEVWIDHFKDDPVIVDYFTRLDNIEKQVFNETDQSIPHVPCKNMPIGLDEESYLLIYSKQQQ